MAGANLTTLDQLTQEVYIPGLKDSVNRSHPLMGRVNDMDSRNFNGREFRWAVKIADNRSPQGIAEDETLPDPGNITPINMTLALFYHYGVARLTAQAAKLVKGAGAFKDSVVTELDSVRDSLKEIVHKYALYGEGSGQLGKVSAYSGTTLTMIPNTTNGGVGSRFLRAGMYVQSYSALTAGSQGANHVLISDIPTDSTATVPGSAGFVANDYVFVSRAASVDPRGKMLMGLGGIIDDATRVTTIQGLSRSTYSVLKARVLGNSGTLRAWTPELMNSLCNETKQNGGGNAPTALYSNLLIQDRAAAYLWNDRRGQLTDMKLPGGYEAVEWHSPSTGKIPWFEDMYTRPHEIMAPHEPDLFWAKHPDGDFSPVDEDGRMWRFTARQDAMEFWLRVWRNLGSYRFNNHSVLRDVSFVL